MDLLWGEFYGFEASWLQGLFRWREKAESFEVG